MSGWFKWLKHAFSHDDGQGKNAKGLLSRVFLDGPQQLFSVLQYLGVTFWPFANRIKAAEGTGETRKSSATRFATGISLLEHVNLNIPTHGPSTTFFFETLGFAVDPRFADNYAKGSGGVWANIGVHQFHMLPGDPQVIPGRIHLSYEDLEEVGRRITAAGVPFETDADTITVRCPNGNTLVLHGGGQRSKFVQPGPMSLGVGMLGIDFPCSVGSSKGIGRFYRYVFDTEVEDGATEVVVKCGPQQFLRFYETSTPFDYDGHHIAVYLASLEAFEQTFRRAEELGVVWVNPRFVDQASTWELASKKFHQFRLVELVDPETRQSLRLLEHEVRAISNEAYPLRP